MTDTPEPRAERVTLARMLDEKGQPYDERSWVVVQDTENLSEPYYEVRTFIPEESLDTGEPRLREALTEDDAERLGSIATGLEHWLSKDTDPDRRDVRFLRDLGKRLRAALTAPPEGSGGGGDEDYVTVRVHRADAAQLAESIVIAEDNEWGEQMQELFTGVLSDPVHTQPEQSEEGS